MRNHKLDILRVFGTYSVIAAHVSPPEFLFQLRAFDVVLLTVVSGMSFAISRPVKYLNYIGKRVKRLVFPTYRFLLTYFLLVYCACLLVGKDQLYTWEQMFYSFLLSDSGMGYIWIVKVYLLVAIFSPLVKYLSQRICNDIVFALLCLALLVISTIVNHISFLQTSSFYIDYISYIIPYTIASGIGIRIAKHEEAIKITFFVFGLAFALCAIYYGQFVPNSYKFPPELYYVSYGIFISSILLQIIPNHFHYMVEYLSTNSFRLYLIHIPVLLFYNLVSDKLRYEWFDIFVLHYLIVIVLSTIILVILNKIEQKIILLKNLRNDELS